jgi:hypothetical protein
VSGQDSCRTQPQDLESAVGVIQMQKEKEMAAGAQEEGTLEAEALAKFLLLHVDAEQVHLSSAKWDLHPRNDASCKHTCFELHSKHVNFLSLLPNTGAVLRASECAGVQGCTCPIRPPNGILSDFLVAEGSCRAFAGAGEVLLDRSRSHAEACNRCQARPPS